MSLHYAGYPQPKLICPTSVNVELHPSDTENTTVRLRHPETDVSWERDVVVEPAWAKKDAFQLPLGSQNVSYSARHPVSKLHTDCTFTINVLREYPLTIWREGNAIIFLLLCFLSILPAGSPPRVDFCPDTQVYTIEGRHQSVKATWEEPVFSDNVGVVTITKSNVSSNTLHLRRWLNLILVPLIVPFRLHQNRAQGQTLVPGAI